MKVKTWLTTGVFAMSMAAPAVFAADASFSDTQKQAIEKVIHQYLVTHPEVLLEASQALQEQQQKNMQEQAQSAIKSNAKNVFNDKMTVVGNPNGNVTLVEFFDYQCSHCKKMAPVVSQLVKDNKNLKVVFKEFPIFGESSDLASRAALAAAMQGKYMAMHEALISQKDRLNKDIIMAAAKKIGLNMEQFQKDIDSKAVKDAIAENRQLAESLRLMGTPAFIIGQTPSGQLKDSSSPSFIPGAASVETLQELITKASS